MPIIPDSEFEDLYRRYATSGVHASDMVLTHYSYLAPEAQRILAKQLIRELHAGATLPRHFTTLKAQPTGQPVPIIPASVAQVETRLLEARTPQELVREWRKMQAKADHQTAEMVRARVHELLNSIVQPTPQELRSFAACLVDLQKVQRLALGLSSENVGMQVDTDTIASGIEVKFAN
jgi:hypothetical protein